jgi:hypothetical protein
MHDRARPVGRFGVFSVFVGAVASVVALSAPAHADDPPSQPSIVVGGTVHPPTAIVVDPQTPSTTAGPIDASKPIGVDPRAQPKAPKAPECCLISNRRYVLEWYPDSVPPVVEVASREIDVAQTAYLDNHGRYWVLNRANLRVEQVGGWPAPVLSGPTGLSGPTSKPPPPPNAATFFPPCSELPTC